MPLKRELQACISAFFGINIKGITDWSDLYGSNYVRSFSVNGEKYVIRKYRQPHPDTAATEKAAYFALAPLGLTDEVLCFDDKGIKITRFIEGEHLGFGERDQEDSIALLRDVHESSPDIPYSYDIFGSIMYWASLCRDPNSQNLKIIRSYQSKIDRIKIILDSMKIKEVLCHGDPCLFSNIMRLKNGSLRIIDWEYAGMADPFMDLAIASVRQGFEKVDPFKSLERYLQRKPTCDETFRLKAYIALGALEYAAWQINEQNARKFQKWLALSCEPYGLNLSFCDRPM